MASPAKHARQSDAAASGDYPDIRRDVDGPIAGDAASK